MRPVSLLMTDADAKWAQRLGQHFDVLAGDAPDLNAEPCPMCSERCGQCACDDDPALD